MEPREGYYQGILQLRDPTKEIIDFIIKDVEKRKDVFIAKTPKVKGGRDFYISSNKYLQILGKKLQTRFGGELKVSPKLFSRDRQTGKNIYRLSVYFRPSQFKKGDLITHKNKIYKIVSLSKKISAKDLTTNKKITLKYDKEIKRIEPIYKTIVSKTKPVIEVLDPETYQSVPVKNKQTVKHGQKVRIIKLKDDIWLV